MSETHCPVMTTSADGRPAEAGGRRASVTMAQGECDRKLSLVVPRLLTTPYPSTLSWDSVGVFHTGTYGRSKVGA